MTSDSPAPAPDRGTDAPEEIGRFSRSRRFTFTISAFVLACLATPIYLLSTDRPDAVVEAVEHADAGQGSGPSDMPEPVSRPRRDAPPTAAEPSAKSKELLGDISGLEAIDPARPKTDAWGADTKSGRRAALGAGGPP